MKCLPLLTVLLVHLASIPAAAQLQQENVLLVWNSRDTESQAVRDLYVARYPAVLEFDLDSVPLSNSNAVTRNNFDALIRDPLRDFINGVTTGSDLSQQIMCLVTTRGVPVRINSTVAGDEFGFASTWTSVESELTLLQQDLTATGAAALQFRYSGSVRNPYHARFNQPITGFSRAGVQTARIFGVNQTAGFQSWQAIGLTPGDMYVVCRLDALPANGNTAVQEIEALLDRAQNAVFACGSGRALLDEYAAVDQLDDEGQANIFPPRDSSENFEFDDYERTRDVLESLNIPVTYDDTSNFVDPSELPDDLPLFVFSTYGENHDVDGSENPSGLGDYVGRYTFHPAAIFLSLESFNGDSIFDGTGRGNQGQVLDAVAGGATFTIGHIREPLAYSVPDTRILVENMLVHGMTFAEAAWSAIPALSWQQVPIGDPLATLQIVPGGAERNGDGVTDVEDLYTYFVGTPLDLDCDGVASLADSLIVRDGVRTGEPTDLVAGR
ncbi:MAG: hypothetical protein AAGD00_07600 [Planctomycetota bacterium]